MKATYNYVVKYEIIATSQSPFKTGNEELLQNKFGEYFIQGTSLVGAFRSWTETYHKNYATLLFGSQQANSHLVVSDGVFENDAKQTSRPRLRIDGKTGSAMVGAKFDVSHIQTYSKMKFSLTWMASKDDITETKIIEKFLEAFNNGEILIGANKTNGFGKFSLEVFQQSYDMFAQKDRNNWLENIFNGEKLYLDTKTQTDKIIFNVVGKADNLLIKGAADHTGQSSFTPNIKEGEFAVIPGSSIKGAVKARVMKIAKTLNIPNEKIEDIFGTLPENNAAVKAGTIYFNDMIAKKAKKKKLPRIHISKFTGGVMEGGLFTEEPICTDINIKIEVPNDKISCALIYYALRDLKLGLYNLGSGYTIGRGEIEIDEIKINVEDIEATKKAWLDAIKEANFEV